jgi:hypothetical protein
MTAVVLSAGRATRLNGMCKALVWVAGRRAVDRQAEVLGVDPLVVVRTEDVQAVRAAKYRPVVCDDLGGPVRALKAALPECDPDEPVVVLFADTMVRSLPLSRSNWVGYDFTWGGREWDTVHLYSNGVFSSRAWFPAKDYRSVAVGAYSFSDVAALRWACENAPDDGPFAWMLNAYPHPLEGVRAHGWQDVGDVEAVGRYDTDV